MLARVDLLTTDPVTGKTTGLARTVRAAVAAMEKSRVPFAVSGAAALSVRGLPRMTAAPAEVNGEAIRS